MSSMTSKRQISVLCEVKYLPDDIMVITYIAHGSTVY